jgi:hypothetical protein
MSIKNYLNGKEVENKIVYYKDTTDSRHLIFWPESQRRVHRHTAEPEPNRRVPVGRVPLLVPRYLHADYMYFMEWRYARKTLLKRFQAEYFYEVSNFENYDNCD